MIYKCFIKQLFCTLHQRFVKWSKISFWNILARNIFMKHNFAIVHLAVFPSFIVSLCGLSLNSYLVFGRTWFCKMRWLLLSQIKYRFLCCVRIYVKPELIKVATATVWWLGFFLFCIWKWDETFNQDPSLYHETSSRS